MNHIETSFIELLAQIDRTIALSDDQLQQLYGFYENLVQWNERMNLTAITNEDEVYLKHFLDSYTMFYSVPRGTIAEGTVIIDVGTGAGFPGIPLAIAMPDVRVTLMDSLGKRVRFLDDTVRKLDLGNVECVHARAEDLARNPKYREHYDIAVSRAVANLSTLSEYCIPFVKIKGQFIAYKSEKVDEGEELESGKRAAGMLGAQLEREHKFLLPGTEYNRTLLTFRKKKNTPGKYPRKAGTPAKDPL